MKLKKFRENLKRYSRLKNLRMLLEKLRLLCSQAMKREKLKCKIEMLNQSLMEKKFDNSDANCELDFKERPLNLIMNKNTSTVFKNSKKLLMKRKRGRPPKNPHKLDKEPYKVRKTNGSKKIEVMGSTKTSKASTKLSKIRQAKENETMVQQNEFIHMIPINDPKKKGRKPKNFYPNMDDQRKIFKGETKPLSQNSTINKLIRKKTANISNENPNEPNDHYEDVKPFKLKNELQKILQTQNLNQLLLLDNLESNSGRLTRMAISKSELRGNKNYKKSSV